MSTAKTEEKKTTTVDTTDRNVVAAIDWNEVLDTSSEEIASRYGEMLHPFFGKEDSNGNLKAFSNEECVKWLDKMKPLIRKAAAKDGINGVIKALKQGGVDVEVKVSGSAAKAFQLESEAEFNWGKLLKWVGAGVGLAVVAYGAYYFYMRYQEKQAGAAKVPFVPM